MCRIEISRGEPTTTDYFLHVLTATDSGVESITPATVQWGHDMLEMNVDGVTIWFSTSRVDGGVALGKKSRRFPSDLE